MSVDFDDSDDSAADVVAATRWVTADCDHAEFDQERLLLNRRCLFLKDPVGLGREYADRFEEENLDGGW